MQKSQPLLFKSLQNPACYNHPVTEVKLIETHISWVFLAGEFAYKLKKPVNFGFLDFSTLKKRQHFCREELRLNQRFAPQLYLDVVSVGGCTENPVIEALPAIDHMVRMKRFARENELDQLLQQNHLTPAMIEQFAVYLAGLHQQLPRVDVNSRFGSPEAVNKPVQANFGHLRPRLPESSQQQKLNALEYCSQTRFGQLFQLMVQRKVQGFIRECHGDVHLANMVWLDDKPLLFDCIEFNADFRCIDVISDSAFLLMDLEDRDAAPLSWHFLNRYLQQTGDYAALPLLDYYKSYRALVRAKVIVLRLEQPGLERKERRQNERLLQSYLDLASEYSHSRKTQLIISHGFSASGKSTFINQFSAEYGGISLHSDIERKRLYGLDARAKSRSAVTAGIYTEQASQQTYARLVELAEVILTAGFPVIVDATFLQQQQRETLWQLARQLKVPFVILDFPLSEKELFRRIELRSCRAGEVSEANVSVLEQQLKMAQPLTGAEQQVTIKIQPDSSPAAIIAQVQSAMRI